MTVDETIPIQGAINENGASLLRDIEPTDFPTTPNARMVAKGARYIVAAKPTHETVEIASRRDLFLTRRFDKISSGHVD